MTAAGPRTASFVLSRWLFLRLLAVVYLIAFVSLGTQVTGLVGDHGVEPIGEFLGRASAAYGMRAYVLWPTLVWVSPTDIGLSVLCWLGTAVSLALLFGVAPTMCSALLWLLYLSLTIAGQDFLQFQWDALLLETGFLAILYAPLAWRSELDGDSEPPAAVRWVLWSLAFKLTFLSGVTKLLSGDPTWANMTALTYHYETQPIPAWTSWYMHQVPGLVHYWSTAGMFVIELAVPWLIFVPPRWARTRLIAAVLMIALQAGIGATGNYGFFNLLTIVLYLGLLDDRVIGRVLRRPARDAAIAVTSVTAWQRVVTGLALLIAVLSTMTFFREMDVTWGRDTALRRLWSARLLTWVAPINSINGYGLFRVMTTDRPEIVIEVSEDGVAWKEYEFRWKPGDIRGAPRFVEPHMPRLDWQMWFAALDPASAQPWLARLLGGLLKGERNIRRLMGNDPLGGKARYVRLAYYRYHLTSRAERARTGAWWKREFTGYLTERLEANSFP